MKIRLLTLLLGLAVCLPALGWELSGHLGMEGRDFLQSPLDPRQMDGDLSFSLEPEFQHEWEDGHQSLTFTPFVRIDRWDSERTHLDIRELEWIMAREYWELRLGVRQVFWGVTEAEHLVDILNQTDLVEDPDGEDKLGQPMANLALIHPDLGTLDLFLLVGSRERTFPGPKGRLRFLPRVDQDLTRHAQGAGQGDLDWALRWSHSIGDWDIGLSHFSGTGRDPFFEPVLKASGEVVLAPVYRHIDQTGLDVQLTTEDTLWKLEVIHRTGGGANFTALDGGLEYTLVGIFDTAADLGLLAEYLYASDGADLFIAFRNDLFLGMRLTLNDEQSTEVLFGVVRGLDGNRRFYNLEASRRFGDAWKLSIEARFFAGLGPQDLLWSFSRDDYIQAELAWYF